MTLFFAEAGHSFGCPRGFVWQRCGESACRNGFGPAEARRYDAAEPRQGLCAVFWAGRDLHERLYWCRLHALELVRDRAARERIPLEATGRRHSVLPKIRQKDGIRSDVCQHRDRTRVYHPEVGLRCRGCAAVDSRRFHAHGSAGDPESIGTIRSFSKRCTTLFRAFGARYDGNPALAFVDIRDYGNWGEGHTGHLGSDPSTILTPPENLKNNYFLPYLQAFPHTQLIVPWGNPLYDDLYAWMVGQGAGIRRDGILSQWTKDGSECLPAFGHAPAVFEYCDSYSDTKKNGYWSTAALLRSVEAGKPSYLQWDPQIFRENSDFCRMLGNKIGYHFVLQEALVPSHLSSGKAATLKLHWLNEGVAPLYEPCSVAVGLLDGSGRVVQKQWGHDECAEDMEAWPSHPRNSLADISGCSRRDLPPGRRLVFQTERPPHPTTAWVSRAARRMAGTFCMIGAGSGLARPPNCIVFSANLVGRHRQPMRL